MSLVSQITTASRTTPNTGIVPPWLLQSDAPDNTGVIQPELQGRNTGVVQPDLEYGQARAGAALIG